MASKRSGRKSSTKKWQFKGFINYYPSGDDKERIKDVVTPTEDKILLFLFDSTESGWKVSFGYDNWKDCYTLAITGKSTGTKYDGYVICVFHSDRDRLMQLAYYVLGILLPDGRIELETQDQDTDW